MVTADTDGLAGVQGRFTVQALPKPDRITTTNRAGARHGSVHADVDLVMLSCCAEDPRIRREVSLRQCGHHAAPTRTGDVEAHGRPNDEGVADPGILCKVFLA